MAVKRLLNCTASDFEQFDREALIQSISASEGRTILAENDVAIQPATRGITNGEYASAFGADLLLLNLFDFGKKSILGITNAEDPVRELKRLTGRPVGVNIEPVDVSADQTEKLTKISAGRIASVENFKAAEALGFDFICLTGNPSTGVSNKEILASISLAKKYFSGMIIAGKMHGAGVAGPVIDHKIASDFIEAGADVILIPVAGTIPGLSELEMSEMVHFVHEKGKLVLGAIGTSQETSDVETIRELGLTSKRAGCDIHHIGDGGPSGHANPENIMALSIAVRGKRWTYHRMAISAMR